MTATQSTQTASFGIPPQAYTRDVLVKAYDWLKAQPMHVREKAVSADSLVSLYLHARKSEGLEGSEGNNWDPNAPTSVESFKSDLKSLAEGLKQFDDSSANWSQNLQSPHRPPYSEPQSPHRLPHNEQQPPHYQIPNNGPQSHFYQSPYMATPPPQMYAPEPQPEIQLDRRSQELIHEVQKRLNLGSQREAIRMLISLGYERVRPLLPPS